MGLTKSGYEGGALEYEDFVHGYPLPDTAKVVPSSRRWPGRTSPQHEGQ